jgi:hypothetical protein
MKELYLLTGYDGFLGQTRKPWISLDTTRFIAELSSLGIIVHQHEFHELVNGKLQLWDSTVFYTFSHRPNLQHYIRDCLLDLRAKGNILIPSFELFCCHENKGWQELFKDQIGIHSLDCHYFSSFREIKHYDLSFPRVFKTINGSNSTGVALVNSQKDIQKELRKHQKSLSWGQKLDFWRRKHLRKHKHFPGYPDYDLHKDAREYQDYMSPEIPFVLQEFIPGLSYDYRVIVLGERYFISKRHTKAGDFRASGAKLFDFELSDVDRILDYAQELYTILGSPFISLDFGEDAAGKLYLFEYQAAHFGINAIVRGSGYYLQQSGKWQFVKQPPQFERYLAQALAHYLEP